MELKLLVTLQRIQMLTQGKRKRTLGDEGDAFRAERRKNVNKTKTMKRLTTKEKEIMELYWQHGPLFVKELLEYYDEPRPHFNTLSTTVRILEKKGFLDHKQFGTSYQYFPTISERDYGRSSLTGIIKNYFDDSYLSAVSSFVKEEKISVEELKELIDQIENSKS